MDSLDKIIFDTLYSGKEKEYIVSDIIKNIKSEKQKIRLDRKKASTIFEKDQNMISMFMGICPEEIKKIEKMGEGAFDAYYERVKSNKKLFKKSIKKYKDQLQMV